MKDVKKAAAGDKQNGNGNGHRNSRSNKVERYTIGDTRTVKRGFLKELCDFTRKKGTVDAEQLIAEFSGRSIDKHKIDTGRVKRYIRYCLNHGQFKVAK